eukprot:2588618-Pleurochrysis_carterae.AAC.2
MPSEYTTKQLLLTVRILTCTRPGSIWSAELVDNVSAAGCFEPAPDDITVPARAAPRKCRSTQPCMATIASA